MPVLKKSNVEAIEINTSAGMPINVIVTVRGHFDNRCGAIDSRDEEGAERGISINWFRLICEEDTACIQDWSILPTLK